MSFGSEKNKSIILKLYTFFTYGSFAILYVFFPLYFAEQGLTMLEVGMIMAGGPFISILANPFWGYMSDKYQNIKRTLLILIIGNLIVVQLVFHIDLFWFLYVIMLVFFFFNSPLNSQGNSLILNTIEGTKQKFGEFRLWGSIGYAMIAVAAGPAILLVGMHRVWIIYTLLLLVSLLFAFRLPRGNIGIPSAIFSLSDYVRIFKQKVFLFFVLLGVLISVPNAINTTFVSLYIQELGGTSVSIGWAAFLSAIFEVPVFLLMDRYIKRETRFMVACLLVVSALFVIRWGLMASVTEPYQVLLIQILHCITFGGYYYLGTILTAQLVSPQFRATGQAAFALTWGGISGIIAGFLGGTLYDVLGATKMYQVSMFIALLGTVGFLFLLKSVKAQWQEGT